MIQRVDYQGFDTGEVFWRSYDTTHGSAMVVREMCMSGVLCRGEASMRNDEWQSTCEDTA